MTSSTNSCTPESGVENVHQIQRETGGLDSKIVLDIGHHRLFNHQGIKYYMDKLGIDAMFLRLFTFGHCIVCPCDIG
jgi:hypothetical protein